MCYHLSCRWYEQELPVEINRNPCRQAIHKADLIKLVRDDHSTRIRLFSPAFMHWAVLRCVCFMRRCCAVLVE